MNNIILLISLIFSVSTFAQNFGRLNIQAVDFQSQQPLDSFSVIIEKKNGDIEYGSEKIKNGYMSIDSLEFGTYNIQIYSKKHEIVFEKIIIQAAKATDLKLELRETLETVLDDVVISQDKDPNFKGNVTTFSAKDFGNITASYGDPARIVQNLPSVVTVNDAGNQIAVRGNSPSNNLYYIEGVEIPNSSVLAGVNGGSISIFNENSLEKFDFYTGAYPAQFSNSNGGIFNLFLRSGNPIKRESLIKISPLGGFLSTEGYIKKGKASSYILNARIWDINWVKNIGVQFKNTEIPSFRDFTFKLKLPVGKKATLSFSSIGGYGSLTKTDKYLYTSTSNLNTTIKSYLPIISILKLKSYLGNKTSFSNILSYAYTRTSLYEKSTSSQIIFGSKNDTDYESSNRDNYHTFKYSNILNTKLNNRTSLSAGINISHILYKFKNKSQLDRVTKNINTDSIIYINQSSGYEKNDKNSKIQFWSSINYRLGINSDVDFGFSSSKYLNTKIQTIEPRLSINLQLSKNYKTVFSCGFTSKDIPFSNFQNYSSLSKKIKPTKSFQFANSHNFIFKKGFNVRLEGFWQSIWNSYLIDSSGVGTMLNYNQSTLFYDNKLSDDGKGNNYGLEYTLTKEFKNIFTIQLAGSFYRSLYLGGDDKWRSTAYDNKYNFVFSGFKEYIKNKSYGLKKTIFNFKVTSFGGFYTPTVDQTASQKSYSVIFQNYYLYDHKMPNYFRADLGIQINYSKVNLRHEFRLDIQNVTNKINVLWYTFDSSKQKVVYTKQLGLVPVISYSIYF